MGSKPNTTATKEEAKAALVPKLRFPEFREMPGWNMEQVGDLVDESRQPSLLNDPSRRITVRLHLQGVEHREHRGTESAESTNNFCRKAGQFIYGKQNIHKGAFGIIPDDLDSFETSRDLPCFDFKRRCFPLWLYYTFAIDEVYRTFELRMTGTGSKRLNEQSFLSLPIAVPPYSEQKQIADCLSSLDELMAAQARKVDALKAHKKGLMQKLFPQEGETQPRLRFPEFRDAGEWSQGRLGEIATVLQGYGFPERYQGQTRGDYPFYKVSDISRSLNAGNIFIKEAANYINERLLKELRAKPIPEGTTIFAKIGEAIRSNKRVITTAPCLIDNNAAGVKRIEGKATDLFICLLMERISLMDHAGGIVPSVNKSVIEAIPVRFPRPDEQHRIATCLSSLDALITAETRKLETLKTHKHGLMQQLFPSFAG